MSIKLKLAFSLKGKLLKDFSNEKVDSLVSDYYNKKSIKVKDLTKMYGLDVLPQKLVKSFPPVIVDDECPYDHHHMIAELQARTAMMTSEDAPYDPKLSCPQCGHMESESSSGYLDKFGTFYCNCQNCQKKRVHQDKWEKESALLLIENQHENDPVKLSDISLEDKIYLSALLHGYLDEDERYIQGTDNEATQDKAFLPSLSERDEADKLDDLNRKHITIFSTSTSLKTFSFDDDYNITSYKPTLANYNLNIENPYDTKETLIHNLLYPKRDEFIDDKAKCLQMWRSIALDECKAYLMQGLHSVSFDRSFQPGKKTDEVIDHLLDDFAESQIFSMIYNRITHATRYYQEYPVSKKQAANSVITNLASYGERALANHWNVSRYLWPYGLKRSQLSQVFFNYVLQIAEQGFHTVPTSDI